MRAVVTGGTGFVGSRVCRELAKAGYEVIPLARSLGVDITRPETLAGRFHRESLVVHLAALVQSRPGPFDRTNLQGLENVLEACREAGVPRLIYVSSFVVFGPSDTEPHLRPVAPARTSYFHDYDRTKCLGLELVNRWRDCIDLNVVFPTVVYGPGPLTEGNLMVRVFRRWLRWRLAVLPRRGSARWNFVHVDDVAAGLAAVAAGPPDRDYILGGENLSLRDLVGLLARVAGRRLPVVGVPDVGFRCGAFLEDRISAWRGVSPLVTPATARLMLHHWEFGSQAAEEDLGYRPRLAAVGVEETWRWMAQEHLV